MAKRPTVVELFTGVGGLGLGLEQAGFNVAVAVELEEIAGRYAQYNFPSAHVLYGGEMGDVRRFGRDRLLSVAPEIGQEIALVAGGPPCQGFSLAGKKDSEDPLNDLVLEFARIVGEVRPMAFLMENVPGITFGTSGHLGEAIRRLRKEYLVTDPTNLWACDFGVPQARERVFLVGIRKDLHVAPSLPEPTHDRPISQQLSLAPRPVTPTVRKAISDLPHVDEYPELIDRDRIPYGCEPTSEFERTMRGQLQDRTDWSMVPEWDEKICTNLRRTQHGPGLTARFRELQFGQMDRMSGIRRLHPDEVATTIRAGTTKERGSWSAPRPLHPFQDRVLTTRECARLQSFPDWFFFHPVKWHGNRQVGNAVPPLLARAIGAHIFRLLRLPPPKAEPPRIQRLDELVMADIDGAATSGLSKRRISQKVVHPRLARVKTDE